MKKWCELHRAALGALVVAAVIGCGGGMGGTSTGSFTGNWSVIWNSPGSGSNGALDMSVAQDGRVTGTLYDAPNQTQGPITGMMSASGHMDATVAFPGQQVCSVSGDMMLNQQDHQNGCHQAGHMAVNGSLHMGNSSYPMSMDMTPR